MKIFTYVNTLFIIFAVVNGDCNVVSKSDWGGLAPIRVEYLPRPLNLVIIGHTVTGACTTNAQCEEVVRNLQTFHMDTFNYWDIRHSFLIGGNGKVYEGTGWLHAGSHTHGYNNRAIGIAFIGNYMMPYLGGWCKKSELISSAKNQLFPGHRCSGVTPFQAAVNALKALLQCGVERGHLAADYRLVGQSQLSFTGWNLYNAINRLPHWSENIDSIEN